MVEGERVEIQPVKEEEAETLVVDGNRVRCSGGEGDGGCDDTHSRCSGCGGGGGGCNDKWGDSVRWWSRRLHWGMERE